MTPLRSAPTSAPGDDVPVFINGKFLAQRVTGVQRVGRALLAAMDAEPGLVPGRLTLLCPAQATLPPLARIELRQVGHARWPLHLWEQLVLPWSARSGLVLNLCGSAPWLASRAITVLHDAALWDVPEAYTPAFRFWYRALFRRQARAAEGLMTVSEPARQRLTAVLGLPAGRCQVLRNGADHLDAVAADPAVLHRLGLCGRPFLLTVASLSPAKNLAMLRQAYARSGIGPAVALVWVGGSSDGVFAKESRGRGQEVGWLDAGVLPDDELKALYGSALALLVPSRHEGFCLPAAEALQAGCPVLASSASALPGLFGPTVASLSPDDVELWAAALRRLVGDVAWRQALLADGRRHLGPARWADTARQLLGQVGLLVEGAS